MDLLLNNKVVLVTGASQGLGKAIATLFCQEGAKVYISSRNEEKLQLAKQNILQEVPNSFVDYKQCDMANKQDIEALIQYVIEREGCIDVLINNAGGPPAGPFANTTDEMWLHSIEQNLLSVVRAIKEVLPYMEEKEAGRIINITSSSMKQAIDDLIISNTLRPGVFGLTKSLAREYAHKNILINAVGAGKIKTDRMQSLMEHKAKTRDETMEKIEELEVEDIPLGRMGQPEELGKAVLFLASFANTYITGQQLVVDGASVKSL